MKVSDNEPMFSNCARERVVEIRLVNVKDARVLYMCNKSLVFFLPKENLEAYASKRVANEILSERAEYVFVETRIDDCGRNQFWLSTPLRF